jgi:hypothetical protein
LAALGAAVVTVIQASKKIEIDGIGIRKRLIRSDSEYDVRWESIGKIEPFTSKDGGYTFIYAGGCCIKLSHLNQCFAPVIREIKRRAPNAVFPNRLNAHNFPPIDPNEIEGKQDRVFRYGFQVTQIQTLFQGSRLDVVLKWDRIVVGKGLFRKPFEAKWEEIDLVCFESAAGKYRTRHYFVSSVQGNGYFTEDIDRYEELIEEIRHRVSDNAYWAVEPIRFKQEVVIEDSVDE